jgi:phosphoenolpyruvate carboxylase
MRFLNPSSYILLPDELVDSIKKLPIDHDVDERHNAITEQVVSDMKKKRFESLDELVLRAANVRGFLG